MIPPTKAVLDEPEAETARDPDAPVTSEQLTILRDLCERHGEEFDGNLTEGQANERIAELEKRET